MKPEPTQTSTTPQPTELSTPKSHNKLAIPLILVSILAVAGLCFGAYEYLQANQTKQQISDLKVEVKNSDGSTTTLETDKIEIKEDTKTVTISDSSVAINPKDYIYIGEWGIKIKIPDTVKDVSYVYESFARGGTAVYVNGHSSDDPTDYASQAYDDSESHFNPAGKGAISLHEVGEEHYGAEYITTVTVGGGQKVITYSGPQSSWWSGIDDQVKAGTLILRDWNFEERLKWEQTAVKAVKEMLTNPENYSAI